MGSMSLIHWIIVGAVLLLVFGGRNKISDVMGDVAKGIKSFKKGLAEDDEPKAAAPPFDAARSIDHQPAAHPYQAPQPYAPAQQPYQPMPQAGQPYPQNGQPYQPQAHPYHPQTEPVARAEPVEPHKAG